MDLFAEKMVCSGLRGEQPEWEMPRRKHCVQYQKELVNCGSLLATLHWAQKMATKIIREREQMTPKEKLTWKRERDDLIILVQIPL